MSVVGFYGGKFLPLHMGHVSCIIQASSKCDLLYVGLSHSKSRDMDLCAKADFPYVSKEIRVAWLHQIANSLPNVKVIDFSDGDGEEYSSWQEGADMVKAQIPSPINLTFGSELEYAEMFDKIYPGSKYVLLDADRSRYPISGTQIREEGAFKHWNSIPVACRPFYVKKVVVVGSESCGKSTLVKKLACYFNTNYVEEYGRELCEKVGTGQPHASYYPQIVYGQKTREFEAGLTANKILIVDTEAIVTQYYANLYEDMDFSEIDAIIDGQHYDLMIFLEPDVEWVDDGLRAHGNQLERENNSNTLKAMLDHYGKDYSIVSGSYSDRFSKSVKLIEDIVL